MTTRGKLILFVTLGFGAILIAIRVLAMGTYWRGILMLAGGWFIAVGSLYQVKLYAEQKDVLYYIMMVMAGVFWLGMLAITVFWCWTFV